MIFLAAQSLVYVPCTTALEFPNKFGIKNGTDCSIQTSCDEVHEKHWDRKTCVVKIKARQRQNPDFWKQFGTPEFFGFREDGQLANTSDNMILTRAGCDEFCGGQTFYWDAIPRLTTWIIPVILLLSNIELSPIDKRRFTTLIHAVGDPIDSFWSILHKIYVWRRLYAIALSKCLKQVGREPGWSSYIERRRELLQRWKREWRHWFRSCALLYSRVKRWWRNFLYYRLRHRWERAAESPFLYGLVRIFGIRTAPMQPVEQPEPDHEDDEDDNDMYDKPHDRARVIATVLAGFEEINGTNIESETHYHMILDQLGRIGQPISDDGSRGQSMGAWDEWRHCARVLADARTNEFLRTLLAIFIYVFGVAAALYDELGGGNTSKPGGRIGSAVYLMWLVPLALLSNTVGSFTSRRTCLTIMHLFVERTTAVMEKEDLERQYRINQEAQSSTRAGKRKARQSHDSELSPEGIRVPERARGDSDSSLDQRPSPVETTNLLAPDRVHSGNVTFRATLWNDEGSSSKVSGRSSRSVELRPIIVVEGGENMIDDNDVVGLLPRTTWDHYFNWLQPLGAIYTYRPWKTDYRTVSMKSHAHYTSNWLFLLLSLFPVAVSVIGAFMIMWYAAPVGWSCRHVWVVGVCLAWLASTACTALIHIKKPFGWSGQVLWIMILVKDGVVGFVGLGLVFLSTSGLFNSCYCWSAYMFHRFLPFDWGREAWVPLNTDDVYDSYARRIYTPIVFGCLGAQLLFYAFIMFIWWDGVSVVRWNEDRCRAEWRHEIAHDDRRITYEQSGKMLFWYSKRDLAKHESIRRESQIAYRRMSSLGNAGR
jgi:hypothetical protein